VSATSPWSAGPAGADACAREAPGVAAPRRAGGVTRSARGRKRLDSACARAHGIYNLAVFQPANRFWLFQGIETAIFGGLALILLAIAVWWTQKRVS
jgi:hypothetical protein